MPRVMSAWIGPIVVCLFAEMVTQSQVPRPSNEGIAPLTPAQIDGIKDFYAHCLQREKVGSVRPLGKAEKSPGMPPGLLCAKVIAASGQREESIEFDPSNGKVLSYYRSGLGDEANTKGLTHKDAIPENIAWERALPVLVYYGMSSSRDEYDIRIVDLSTREQAGDLCGAFWEVSKDLAYEGVPCKLCRISVWISCSSGEILSIIYAPISVPREAQQIVTKGEAVEKAKSWLADRQLLKGKATTIDEASSDSLTKVIARPIGILLAKGESLGLQDTGEAYYCWEVPFKITENEEGRTHFVWVRMDTGDVIGGY